MLLIAFLVPKGNEKLNIERERLTNLDVRIILQICCAIVRTQGKIHMTKMERNRFRLRV